MSLPAGGRCVAATSTLRPLPAVEGEYISAMTFTEDVVNRGAFLDRNPYTRLVTYSNLNDLRAANETFDRIGGDDPRPGPEVTDQEGNPVGHRRPWVYMGPGLYFNHETRRIHIRLAHTHNNLGRCHRLRRGDRSPPRAARHLTARHTVLTEDQRGEASFLHYRDATGPNRRRYFNNIFVALNPAPEADRAITFISPAAVPEPTDGNVYHRIGRATHDLFRHASGTFAGLAQLRASVLFAQSKSQYPPGYEANSLVADPLFLDVATDLRLGERSPALAAGVRLPADLTVLDPLQPPTGRPDIGGYPGGAPPLHVGVDGCRSFPEVGVAPIARPRRLAAGCGNRCSCTRSRTGIRPTSKRFPAN